MDFFQRLRDVFTCRAQSPATAIPERVFHEKMYRELVSKPDSSLHVHRLHLTEKQYKGLIVKKPVKIPGVEPKKWYHL